MRRPGIADESCLQSPDLRNDFEHFDERLEAIYADPEPRGFMGRSIVDDDSLLEHMPGQHFGYSTCQPMS
jgi:hypothetical protein